MKEKFFKILIKYKFPIEYLQCILAIVEMSLMFLWAALSDITGISYMWIFTVMKILFVPFIISIIFYTILVFNGAYYTGD